MKNLLIFINSTANQQTTISIKGSIIFSGLCNLSLSDAHTEMASAPFPLYSFSSYFSFASVLLTLAVLISLVAFRSIRLGATDKQLNRTKCTMRSSAMAIFLNCIFKSALLLQSILRENEKRLSKCYKEKYLPGRQSLEL